MIISDDYEEQYDTYCLIIRRSNSGSIQIGKLDSFHFPKGNYVYVGSARSGLTSRIQRHRSNDKTLYWHIDYLLAENNITDVVLSDRSECSTYQLIRNREESTVIADQFGSSDCTCQSHLLYFQVVPDGLFDKQCFQIIQKGDC